LSFDKLKSPSKVEGFKASPERRPERPKSKSLDRLGTLRRLEGPVGRLFIKAKGLHE